MGFGIVQQVSRETLGWRWEVDTATHEIQIPATDPVAHEIEASGQEQLALDLGDRKRLLELAAAVRAHQASVSGLVGSARPHDLALYRRLRQIGGSQ
jgi:hypothetical protein